MINNQKKCYHSHPPLKIGEYEVFGGSCGYPAVEDADIYIGLDYTMAQTAKQYPWEKGHSFPYRITDMQAPSNPESFKNLIVWMASQIKAGEKVHVGCIGGHGRTGTVLSALVAHMTGNKDAITYVRENYCHKAVESKVQVEFLVKYFGVNPVKGAKEYDEESKPQYYNSQPKAYHSMANNNPNRTTHKPNNSHYQAKNSRNSDVEAFEVVMKKGSSLSMW